MCVAQHANTSANKRLSENKWNHGILPTKIKRERERERRQQSQTLLLLLWLKEHSPPR
jgi:hypothetical protein